MADARVKALILAGGVSWTGDPVALLRLGNRTLLQITTDALTQLSFLTTIGVVGPKEVLDQAPPTFVKVAAAKSLWDNVFLGCRALDLSRDEWVLLCAVDMPFVTAQALERFFALARERSADLTYLAVPLDSVKRLLGNDQVHRTFARLKEGILTGGNVFLLRGRCLTALDLVAQKALNSRKSLWRLALLAGPQLILKFVTGQLSVKDLEKRAENILRHSCYGVVADLPEIAFDIDKPADYELARKIVNQKNFRFGSGTD
ncbi:MAG: NTP transferase domain-containing protein [Armatimonadetes bacterium]|nr:NTP transferase domain-containing protein [Armatimonadota bacterium]MDW8121410.1 NTP transferase domain-containing protein [Armatimonadota bacterium]